jgi:rhamnose transport system ATP-binding protein
VEIAKALSTDARVIVMDEPTAALSAKEVDRLFHVARTLRDQGHAVVFVSHRLDEVFALCDRMTVMRDGATVGTELLSDVTEADLVRLMVGRDVSELFPKLDTEIGDAVLEVSELGKAGEFEGISFSVRAGEILGIAGLVGSGRSEVVRAVFGVDKYDRGSVRLFGKQLPKGNAAAAMKAGMALVPEDRRQQGLLMPTAIARNASLAILRSVARLGLIRQGLERKKTTEWVERLSLKFASISDPVERLSGGNQQKVVLAKWLATEPKLLIVDEPTRGIDVGTKAEVHRLLSQKAKEGMAVIMVSSELPEVLGMSDRIIVMREGRIAGELSRQDASPEKVIMAATGAGSQA